jgi:hypothetical protein
VTIDAQEATHRFGHQSRAGRHRSTMFQNRREDPKVPPETKINLQIANMGPT